MERINSIYIIYYGEIRFGLRTLRFTDDLTERITYVNRGSTVLETCGVLSLPFVREVQILEGAASRIFRDESPEF